jgi:hypothetical protein
MEEASRPRPRSARQRLAVLLSLAVLGAGGVAAPVATAASVEGGNSFNELSSRAQEQEQTTSTATSTTAKTETEAHNSNTTIFIGIGAAVVLLLAIATVIVRDARRVAPAGAEELSEGRSARDAAARRRNRRAKSKAARAQRKKNR